MQPVRIGTRGSRLALVQARAVADALHPSGIPSELVIIETTGDRRPIDTAWGEGACAGLDRLGAADRISQRIPPDLIPPAPGQGAIAVQVRADDEASRAIVDRVDHRATRLAVEAERRMLAAAGGGCRSPIGALATV